MTTTEKMNPFLGRWRIVRLDNFDEAFAHSECTPYLVFEDDNDGEFQIATCNGEIDYRVGTRDGLPVVEWTWSGLEDEMSEFSIPSKNKVVNVHGRGWAVLKDDMLHGEVLGHNGLATGFVARKSASPFVTR